MDWIASFVQNFGSKVWPVGGALRFPADDYDAAKDYAESYADAYNVRLNVLIISKPTFQAFDGRTTDTLYTDENGSATLEISGYDNPILFIRASGAEFDPCSCWSIEEAEILHLFLGRKIEAARATRERFS